jgi:hypothetical protein
MIYVLRLLTCLTMRFRKEDVYFIICLELKNFSPTLGTGVAFFKCCIFSHLPSS